jgi:hypothetical protein
LSRAFIIIAFEFTNELQKLAIGVVKEVDEVSGYRKMKDTMWNAL